MLHLTKRLYLLPTPYFSRDTNTHTRNPSHGMHKLLISTKISYQSHYLRRHNYFLHKALLLEGTNTPYKNPSHLHPFFPLNLEVVMENCPSTAKRRRLRLKLEQQSLDDGSAIGDRRSVRSDQSLRRRRLALNPSSPLTPRRDATALCAAPQASLKRSVEVIQQQGIQRVNDKEAEQDEKKTTPSSLAVRNKAVKPSLTLVQHCRTAPSAQKLPKNELKQPNLEKGLKTGTSVVQEIKCKLYAKFHALIFAHLFRRKGFEVSHD
ncbi:hypothetical protein SO802_024732 [Lithocarpus litseifolius]|uniref:Uncharacterized protein n=1 Tax=Lithocarpus litseifolius TaxID=425828 RepID=A0AAW2CDQ3_9ROSI